MKFKSIQWLPCLALLLFASTLAVVRAEISPQRLSTKEVNDALKQGRKAIRAGEYNKAIAIYQ
ncbi:MAG TPA: hypothetical protein VID27_07220, partial [Blastocatellia bacterium]